MRFNYTPKYTRPIPGDTAVFTLDRIWAWDGMTDREVSHLLDRTFEYQSPRQLQWHLADRFGLSVDAVRVSRC